MNSKFKIQKASAMSLLLSVRCPRRPPQPWHRGGVSPFALTLFLALPRITIHPGKNFAQLDANRPYSDKNTKLLKCSKSMWLHMI